MLVLLIPLALGVAFTKVNLEHVHFVAAGIVTILPQGRIFTRCTDLRQFGRSPALYLWANEILLIFIAAVVVILHIAFRTIFS